MPMGNVIDTESSRRPQALDHYIGQRLRMARVVAGLSQADLSARVGVTFQQLQKYERGTNRISASRLYDMAMALHLSPYYFYDGYGEDLSFAVALDRQSMRLVHHFRRIESEALRNALAETVRQAAQSRFHRRSSKNAT